MSLKDTATAVRLNAHAPYSNFQVGAAIRSASGKVYAGCNVENVAYPEGTCAEAGAISAMVAAGETELVEVYVIAGSHGRNRAGFRTGSFRISHVFYIASRINLARCRA
ncbi:MAG: cytidine deaminase, partial [Pseudomonadota bacterium]